MASPINRDAMTIRTLQRRCADLEVEVDRLRGECRRRGDMLDAFRDMMERAMAHIAPEQSLFKELHEAVYPPPETDGETATRMWFSEEESEEFVDGIMDRLEEEKP